MPTVSTVARWQDLDPGTVGGRVVAVIDVLRWSTVAISALEGGAERVESCATPEEALARADALGRDRVVLGGERESRALPGFDVGNSPREYTPDRVAGRPVVTTTTNGTQALRAAAPARRVIIAAFRNLAAVTRTLSAAVERGEDVVLLAAGQAGEETLEDLACAGAIAEGITERIAKRSGSARPVADAETQRATAVWQAAGRDVGRVMEGSAHARALRGVGFGDDVTFCAMRDASPMVPVLGPRGCVPSPDPDR